MPTYTLISSDSHIIEPPDLREQHIDPPIFGYKSTEYCDSWRPVSSSLAKAQVPTLLRPPVRS
jgi:hypothetical protein